MATSTKKKENLMVSGDAAAAELCRRHFSEFVKEFWDEVIGEDMVWNWHMDVVCREIQQVYERVIRREDKLYDLIINIPPGTTKSTIVSQMAQAWGWTLDPSLRHITGSYTDDVAKEHSVKCRDIVRSEKYKRYFPYVFLKPDEKSKHNFKTTAGGQRYTTSTDGAVMSIHAHIQSVDDPLDPKRAAKKAELDKANKWIGSDLSTRKVDKKLTVLILVMQRLAVNDPSGYLLEKAKNNPKKRVRHICLPAELSNEVKPAVYKQFYKNGLLDPIRIGPEAIEEARIDLGAAGYAGQFMQMPTPPGGLIWKSKWFIKVPDEDFPDRKYLQRFGTDWDLAYTKDDDNAASAYVSSGVLNNRIYIDDIGWRWYEFPELITWMKTKQGPHYIEAKASGKSAKQTLSSQGVIAIEVPVKGGNDKITRANMGTPTAEAGMVCVRASIWDRLFNDSRQGISFFPRGECADLADCFAQTMQRHSRKGRLVTQDGTENEY